MARKNKEMYIKFLKRTKKGDYGEINKKYIKYPRIKEIRQEYLVEEDDYYYSMS